MLIVERRGLLMLGVNPLILLDARDQFLDLDVYPGHFLDLDGCMGPTH